MTILLANRSDRYRDVFELFGSFVLSELGDFSDFLDACDFPGESGSSINRDALDVGVLVGVFMGVHVLVVVYVLGDVLVSTCGSA